MRGRCTDVCLKDFHVCFPGAHIVQHFAGTLNLKLHSRMHVQDYFGNPTRNPASPDFGDVLRLEMPLNASTVPLTGLSLFSLVPRPDNTNFISKGASRVSRAAHS